MTSPEDLHPPAAAVRAVVAAALAEDLLPLGDLTAALVPAGVQARAAFMARENGVLAGTLCVTETVAQVDPSLRLEWRAAEGEALKPGTVIATVAGPLRSILTAERTALNLLCHLSGVATATSRYARAVAAASTGCRVRDTRKTTPGLRALEKAAVRAGGGVNHRANLSDAILVKDNHLGGLSIAQAVEAARRRWPGRHVEVECDTPAQLDEALRADADMVLLDNMTPAEVASCVDMVRRACEGRRQVPVEVSGRVSLDEAENYAAAGADFVSVGGITHSAPVLDIGLDLATA